MMASSISPTKEDSEDLKAAKEKAVKKKVVKKKIAKKAVKKD